MAHDGSITRNKDAVAFLEEMESKMPSEITVLTANFSNDGVSLNITVPDFEEAANVIRQFRSFESLEVIDVSAIAKSTDGESGGSTASFSLSARYPVVVETTTAPETTAEAQAE